MGSDHSSINEFGVRAYTIRRLLTKVSLSPKESYHGTRAQDIESCTLMPLIPGWSPRAAEGPC